MYGVHREIEKKRDSKRTGQKRMAFPNVTTLVHSLTRDLKLQKEKK